MPARRTALAVLAMLSLPLPGGAQAREAEGPRRNLLVELRWVESTLSGAALAGARDGGTVVGTAGSVSTRPGPVLSTRRLEDAAPPAQRLTVLNGRAARVALSQPITVQWTEIAVDLPLETARRNGDRSIDRSSGRADGARVLAAPRSTVVEQLRSFEVRPFWPGGTQPVRVELDAQAPAAEGGTSAVRSTVQVPLGDWVTVARMGDAAERPEPGVLSTRAAEARPQRELQLRVGLAP